jgi:hypothetical protein
MQQFFFSHFADSSGKRPDAGGGWRCFGIQAMTHNSISDDTAPFDVQAWHMPFRVDQGDVDY